MNVFILWWWLTQTCTWLSAVLWWPTAHGQWCDTLSPPPPPPIDLTLRWWWVGCLCKTSCCMCLLQRILFRTMSVVLSSINCFCEPPGGSRNTTLTLSHLQTVVANMLANSCLRPLRAICEWHLSHHIWSIVNMKIYSSFNKEPSL